MGDKKKYFFGLWLVCLLVPLAGFTADKHFGVTANLQSNKAGENQLNIRVIIPPGFKLYADQFQVEIPKPLKIIPLSLPVPQSEKDVFSGEQKLVYSQSFTAVYLIENLTNETVNVKVHYQGCDQKTCFLPAEENFQLKAENMPGVLENDKNDLGGVISDLRGDDDYRLQYCHSRESGNPASGLNISGFPIRSGMTSALITGGLRVAENGRADWLKDNYKVVAIQSGYMDARGFLSFLDFSGKRGAEFSSIQQTWQYGKLWISVLLMILGGLALNLTPCVLPLIPVNLAIIGAGVRAGSVRRGFILGTFYGLGIVLAYGGLGLVTVLTGAQFGAINASSWFNLGVAFLFVILGLALLDVFMIDFSRFQSRFQLKGQGMLFILVLGAVSALLAGACVAPVVIAVLLLAAGLYMKGQIIGLLMPFLLGLGMALPWPFAGAGLSFLPKPGKWMIHIKHIFAVIILLTAFYYFYLGSKLLYARYNIPTDPRVTHSDLSLNADAGWLVFPEGLAAANKEKRPILVYFWATWCKSCQAMSATTFNDLLVRKRMDEFICIKFQAENPQDKLTKTVLREFGVVGLPTFVILQPNEAQ